MSRAAMLVAVAAMLAGCQSYGGAGRGWYSDLDRPRPAYGAWRAYPYPYGYGIGRPHYSLADQLAYERWVARRRGIERHHRRAAPEPERPPATPPEAQPGPTDDERAEILRWALEQLRQQERGP